MPFKKLGEFIELEPCRHPEHYPPGMIVLQPGIYEYTCPACGHMTLVTKRKNFTLSVEDQPLSSNK